jgi:hypothetical protein
VGPKKMHPGKSGGEGTTIVFFITQIAMTIKLMIATIKVNPMNIVILLL